MFQATEQGILIQAEIEGLPVTNDICRGNFFGFHIHEGTACSDINPDAFADAKMHYNPTNCPHPFHAGDLPPLLSNNSYAYMQVISNRFSLDDIIGKTVIIHDKPDDFTTQPSGNSGQKIACGIIKRLN